MSVKQEFKVEFLTVTVMDGEVWLYSSHPNTAPDHDSREIILTHSQAREVFERIAAAGADDDFDFLVGNHVSAMSMPRYGEPWVQMNVGPWKVLQFKRSEVAEVLKRLAT